MNDTPAINMTDSSDHAFFGVINDKEPREIRATTKSFESSRLLQSYCSNALAM